MNFEYLTTEYKVIVNVVLNCACTEGTAIFRCIIDGDPTPKIEWSKGKWKKIEKSATTRLFVDEATSEQVLEMDKCKSKDAGTYTVTITNDFGSDSCSATLIVTDKAEEVEDWKAHLKKTLVALNYYSFNLSIHFALVAYMCYVRT